ncbi:TolC family outer membrane protein [Luminiphilus sp.]|nr:TolC family outer membrane protein [Luminiphilus sp.]
MTPLFIRRTLMGLAVVCLMPISPQGYSDTLLDIYELALQNDAQLRAQEAQYLANLETENLALSALLPQVNAGYSISGNVNETVSPQIVGFEGDPNTGATIPIIADGFNKRDTETEGWNVALAQPLFDLSAWYNLQSGQEFSKQAEAEFAAATQNLIVRTVDAYLTVLRAQDNLAADFGLEGGVSALQKIAGLEAIAAVVPVSLIAITDVYEAEAARDLAEVQRIVEENNVAVAKERLSILTGQTHGELFRLSEDFEAQPPAPADRAAWVKLALDNNYDLAAARYAEESARQSAKASSMGHAPTVTASYQYSDTDTDGSQISEPRQLFQIQPDSQDTREVWEVRLNVPIFQGGRLHAQRRQAAQQHIVATESRVNLERTTITNARSLHMTVKSDAARVRARKQSIRSAQSALDATEAGYDVGTRNIVDVLNAQNLLYTSLRDYANARYDYVVNLLRLKENSGTLSPDDVARLDAALIPPPAASATETQDDTDSTTP